MGIVWIGPVEDLDVVAAFGFLFAKVDFEIQESFFDFCIDRYTADLLYNRLLSAIRADEIKVAVDTPVSFPVKREGHIQKIAGFCQLCIRNACFRR